MFRIGRQRLRYDNQRILGDANWGQAGQRHDAALISWKPTANHHLDVVAAFADVWKRVSCNATRWRQRKNPKPDLSDGKFLTEIIQL